MYRTTYTGTCTLHSTVQTVNSKYSNKFTTLPPWPERISANKSWDSKEICEKTPINTDWSHLTNHIEINFKIVTYI